MNNDVINTKNRPKVSEQQLSVYVSYIMLKKCHVNAVALSRVVMEYGSLPTFIVCVCVHACEFVHAYMYMFTFYARMVVMP